MLVAMDSISQFFDALDATIASNFHWNIEFDSSFCVQNTDISIE
jgi:hypothetical protein